MHLKKHYADAMKLMVAALLAVVLTFSGDVHAQRRLSENEMIRLFGYKSYDYPDTNKVHTCAYLSLSSNAYTDNKKHYAHLECNCVRKIVDCKGKRRMNIMRKCCPGFKEFRDGSESRCMERVLPRNTFQKTLVDMDASAISAGLFDGANGAKFNDSKDTYTVFAVRDSDGMRSTTFQSQATSTMNTNSPVFVHVAKGRVYTQALNQEHSLPTLHQNGNRNSNIKFTRYSNGIMCVECSVIKEANYEVANGVAHVVDAPFLKSATQKSLADTLQADYGYFWSALSSEVKAKLSGTSCNGWFTVFVPTQAQWQNADALTAANHVIKGLWCSHALVSQSSANLPTEAGDVIQLGCSGDNRDQILVTSNGRNAQVDSSARGMSFDRMATNGVIHVINGKLTPRGGLTFRFAAQLEDVEADEPRNSLYYEFDSCGIEFEASKKYIVLVPTLQAMTKFYKYRSTKKDAKQYLRSENSRCDLLRYHILMAEDGVTDLERVMHLQKSYKTLAGNDVQVSDFVIASGNKITPYFMYAKSSDSQEFEHGHIYRIDRVLLPPTAQRWSNVINNGRGLSASLRRTLPARMRNLAVMEAAAPKGHQCTHFVPPQSDLEEDILVRHSAKYSIWSNYLKIGDSLELSACESAADSSKLVLRRVGVKHYTLNFLGSTHKVNVLIGNILRPSGMLWFIDSTLSE